MTDAIKKKTKTLEEHLREWEKNLEYAISDLKRIREESKKTNPYMNLDHIDGNIAATKQTLYSLKDVLFRFTELPMLDQVFLASDTGSKRDVNRNGKEVEDET